MANAMLAPEPERRDNLTKEIKKKASPTIIHHKLRQAFRRTLLQCSPRLLPTLRGSQLRCDQQSTACPLREPHNDRQEKGNSKTRAKTNGPPESQ